jgi:hypothetical protein
MNEELIERLKKVASERTWADGLEEPDTIIDDYAGGNIDDAYYGGERSGEASMARSILKELGIEFVIEG